MDPHSRQPEYGRDLLKAALTRRQGSEKMNLAFHARLMELALQAGNAR
jgi:hypothetical protein